MQDENRLDVEHFHPIERETPDSRVNIEERGRTLVLHRVLESELRDVGALQNAANLAFFTLTVGLAVAFAIVLLTTHQTLSDRILTLFGGLCFISFVAAAYFGLMARKDWKTSQRRIESILRGGSAGS